ncbi:hypothetical protein DL98DRAFT_649351 [Cadophora sp. DSE1049]|nr:hypothetical protein DL98DRAFT_649351 [Cadophora sp. DSE1049]
MKPIPFSAPAKTNTAATIATPATSAKREAATGTSAQKRAQMLGKVFLSEIVHIKVGPELKDFGTKTGVMKLQETSIEAFELFVNWLYTQSLWSESGDKKCEENLECLVHLYVFADMVRVPSLMNQTLDTLQKIRDRALKIPGVGSLSSAWNNTTDTSPFRRLIVDWIVWDLRASTFDDSWLDQMPAQCVLEVLRAMRTVINQFKNTALGEKMKPTQRMNNYYVLEDTEGPSS